MYMARHAYQGDALFLKWLRIVKKITTFLFFSRCIHRASLGEKCLFLTCRLRVLKHLNPPAETCGLFDSILKSLPKELCFPRVRLPCLGGNLQFISMVLKRTIYFVFKIIICLFSPGKTHFAQCTKYSASCGVCIL